MTGSEIFSSGNILKTFLASKVDGDNIVSQLRAKGRKSAILGDNTWVKLYNFDSESVCTNTFDVYDLETCDRVVYDNLPTYLNRKDNPSDIDFIVTHLLGIDHVGHSTSSLTSPMMEVKIKEFSKFIAGMFEESQKETMFIVTGDHGMRPDGNHGGTSTEEVETFIFGFLKDETMFSGKTVKEVAHADITTTLALLLDLPLPKNAIGYPILGMLPSAMISKQALVDINRNLLSHFSSLLEFYGLALTSEEKVSYEAKLNENTDIGEQETMIESLAKRLNFLKYSAPDPNSIIMLAGIVSFLPVAFLFYIFAPELCRVARQCRGNLFLTLFCEGFPMFTLFISYFSWAVIQKLSEALIIGFLIAAIFGILLTPTVDSKFKALGIVVGSFFVLAQMEPDKSNDYKPSMLRNELLNDVVNHALFRFLVASSILNLYLRGPIS
jgi:hypothetical protein